MQDRIETCEVFGSAKCEEGTGAQASTCYEYHHTVAKRARIILLCTIPFDQESKELRSRVIFGANKLALR
jgi:hypothetical protein